MFKSLNHTAMVIKSDKKIVRHVGYTMGEDELIRVKSLATYLVDFYRDQSTVFSPFLSQC